MKRITKEEVAIALRLIEDYKKQLIMDMQHAQEESERINNILLNRENKTEKND